MTRLLTTMALPVPAPGTALNGSGEAYIASLQIQIDCGADKGYAETTGDVLETLLMAVSLRGIAFHPRTFAFSPFGVNGSKFVALLERNWSSIDAAGSDVVNLANTLIDFGKRSQRISFQQIN